jgi:uncharacterized protein (TIGR01777 family)
MNIAVTGSNGFVGSALVSWLKDRGHRVLRLVRSTGHSTGDCVAWDPGAGRIDAAGLEAVDAVVHLAGENIAARRWNTRQKERIRASRVQGTELLTKTLGALRLPPKVLVSASAIGFYGSRGDEELDERSASGQGFLAGVCRAWEAATQHAAEAGMRVVQLRFGIILSRNGGPLPKMLLPFLLGLGGRIGDGRQWMSWIALDDVLGGIDHAIRNDGLRGPVNAVAPTPVTNREFTATLGKVLRRPALLPLPRLVARLAFGEMANELLLASTRVVPRALLQSNYQYLYPELAGALRHLLGQAPVQVACQNQ